jgi:hypothetical protein
MDTPKAPYSEGPDLVYAGPQSISQPAPGVGNNVPVAGRPDRVGYPPARVFDTHRTPRPLFRDSVLDYEQQHVSGVPVVQALKAQIVRLRPLRRFKRVV